MELLIQLMILMSLATTFLPCSQDDYIQQYLVIPTKIFPVPSELRVFFSILRLEVSLSKINPIFDSVR